LDVLGPDAGAARMIINIILGLFVLAVLSYYLAQYFQSRKSVRSILDEEIEEQRRRRRRKEENLRGIREVIRSRTEELAAAVKEIESALGGRAEVSSRSEEQTVYLDLEGETLAATFRLPEYDLSAEDLDVQRYAEEYGKYLLETPSGAREEYRSLQEVVRVMARLAARKVDEGPSG
jgi:hypothetical protein